MLTGPAIRKAVEDGDIVIHPYTWSYAGPNSYDVRLAEEMLVYDVQGPLYPSNAYVGEDGQVRPRVSFLDSRVENETVKLQIDPEKGAVLVPGVVYLGRTVERIHSKRYASTIHGRSSVGRLGVTVHQTAAFIDVGFDGVVTLEIGVTHPVRIYAGMRIAQIAFHPLVGRIEPYRGKYQGADAVQASKLFEDEEEEREEKPQ